MTMRIWHQSFTVLEDLPDYRAAMQAHIRKVVRPDTEVVMHGLVPGSYKSNYPGTDLAYGPLYAIHGMQWIVQALKAQRGQFDAFAMATIPNPLIREIRALIDMPVVGYGEASFHLACMLGHRFGLLMFIDRMIPLLREQIEGYGLASRCAGIEPVGFTFQDVLPAFKDPGPLIKRFEASARALIRQGADVIVPGEMPLNLLLAANGVSRVDDVPIVDGLAVTMKMAETLVDLRRSVGLKQSRHGWMSAAPQAGRVEELLTFYGVDRLLNK
jgi:Asp/Glu/hydantoin racemase